MTTALTEGVLKPPSHREEAPGPRRIWPSPRRRMTQLRRTSPRRRRLHGGSVSTLSAAPTRAIGVKRARGINPVAFAWCRRAGPDCSSGSSSQLPGLPAAPEGSSWSARSRAAARTNDLEAGQRRKIIGERGRSLRGVVYAGSRMWSRGVAGGVVSQAPIRTSPRRVAGCHDQMSGTGLLSHVIERGLSACSCRWGERARGLATLPVVGAAAAGAAGAAGVLVPAPCRPASTW